jgi:glycosyltransferase involved in cell wall biosynthesis
MRILHCVESYYPSIGGMQEVVKQLSERLVKLGHSVTIATRYQEERNFKELNGVEIVDFKISGNTVLGIKGDKTQYEQFLLNSTFDVITFFAAQQWATDIALPLLKQIKAKKVSVPTGYSGLYWKEYQGYFNDMKTYIQDYDMNVFLSDNYRDINFARENRVTKYCVIPNGAAEDEFLIESKIDVRKKLGIAKDSFLMLHVGSFTPFKGHQEAVELLLKSDLKNATLLLIGNNHLQFEKQFKKNYRYFTLRVKNFFRKNKIIIGQFNRDFTVAAYKQSNLFLFPSNIECSPIVLFESAAAKLPFLCTDVGNASEIAKWTQGGMILPTQIDKEGYSSIKMNESISMLNELYLNKAKREEMASKAFLNWKEKFSWEIIAKKYESLYLSLTNSK